MASTKTSLRALVHQMDTRWFRHDAHAFHLPSSGPAQVLDEELVIEFNARSQVRVVVWNNFGKMIELYKGVDYLTAIKTFNNYEPKP